MEIQVTITYDVTTPESVEHGDTADHGFYGPGGWKYSIADDDFQARVKRVGRQQALADMSPTPEIFDSVNDAVAFIERDGPFEASCYPPCSNGHCWLTQTDTSDDRAYYERGEDTRLSYHIEVGLSTDPRIRRSQRINAQNIIQREIISALI